MPKRLLIEHEWYPFKIQKEVNIPDEGLFYILIDPNGYKHLLKKGYYLQYNFQIGDTIMCRIDKINCSGKIYIEPEHPFYKEGSAYDFQFVEKKTIIDPFNELEEIVVVADIFGNQIQISAENITIANHKINCVVEQIKKGALIIASSNGTKSIKGIKVGDWFFATLKKTIQNIENENFYLLVDRGGQTFYLPTKYYESYNFKIGETIHCKLVKIRSPWDYVIEPKNPYYIEGSSYDFVIEQKEIIRNYQLTEVYFFITHDQFNIESKIEVDAAIFHAKTVGETITCNVNRIKKSKLLLSYSLQNP